MCFVIFIEQTIRSRVFSLLILLLSYPFTFMFILRSTHNTEKKTNCLHERKAKRVSLSMDEKQKREKKYRTEAFLFVLTIVYIKRGDSLSIPHCISVFTFCIRLPIPKDRNVNQRLAHVRRDK
jgi:hypothetical protein